MMKRVLAAVLTGTMILSAGMQVWAAPSIQGGGAQQGDVPAEQVVEQQTEPESENLQVGELEEVTVEPLPEGTVTWQDIDREKYSEEQLAVIDALNNADAEITVKDAFGDLVDLTELKLFDQEGEIRNEEVDVEALLAELKFLSPVWDLVFDGVEPTKENPVLCTFTVNNLTEDMEVYMLFNCEEDGWELLEAEPVADNQVKVAIHSTSAPAALVYRLKDEMQDTAAGTSPVAAEEETESETAEN